ncbi:hypothetical protein PGT21_035580 [Puccinia graminis f. sp. tritici]|uniref:Uncharacterized protein n=1 Tax=Puccinia graminis f. sp. tritici TaxID=56615 RepID=A0A5B0PZZ8_PUCGR|nr:hypothetical protein PGT21_035580 [Puccinia graminis f. sp. tritici]KAA1126313.1 hypothetical protein PGTUg99_025987 [Puccinia graminis f. sp. tritici]
MLDRNDNRISKPRKLDYCSHSPLRNRETGLTPSTTPSRSRSQTPRCGRSGHELDLAQISEPSLNHPHIRNQPTSIIIRSVHLHLSPLSSLVHLNARCGQPLLL